MSKQNTIIKSIVNNNKVFSKEATIAAVFRVVMEKKRTFCGFEEIN